MLRKIVSFLMALLLMAAFYVFAVMMESPDSQREALLHDSAATPKPEAIADMQPLTSQDAAALASAFGASLPLPEGFVTGSVQAGNHQGQVTRLVSLTGSMARVSGVRPASAIASLVPRDAAFSRTDKALLGAYLLTAQLPSGRVYSLITQHAAFYIEPINPPQAGGFSRVDP